MNNKNSLADIFEISLSNQQTIKQTKKRATTMADQIEDLITDAQDAYFDGSCLVEFDLRLIIRLLQAITLK